MSQTLVTVFRSEEVMDIESLAWKIIFVTLMVACLGIASIGVIIWFVALDTPLFLKYIVSVLWFGCCVF